MPITNLKTFLGGHAGEVIQMPDGIMQLTKMMCGCGEQSLVWNLFLYKLRFFARDAAERLGEGLQMMIASAPTGI
jgi:hypothetical protein